jgi:hypothetical protein
LNPYPLWRSRARPICFEMSEYDIFRLEICLFWRIFSCYCYYSLWRIGLGCTECFCATVVYLDIKLELDFNTISPCIRIVSAVAHYMTTILQIFHLPNGRMNVLNNNTHKYEHLWWTKKILKLCNCKDIEFLGDRRFWIQVINWQWTLYMRNIIKYTGWKSLERQSHGNEILSTSKRLLSGTVA